MKAEILDLASLLDNAAAEATLIDQLSLEHDITLKDAYELQAASIAKRIDRGETLVGYKLGFTSRAKMEQMGVHELIWGRLTNTMQILPGGELDMRKFIHPRAEPEIAFRIKKDVDREITLSEAKDYIDGVATAIEFIDSRYKDFKFSLEDVIADNCSSSGFVIGDWHDAQCDVSDLQMSLQINGNEVQAGSSKAILGNPLESLVEASRIFRNYGEELKAGMILLAGAATPAVYINPGDQIDVVCENLGTVGAKAV